MGKVLDSLSLSFLIYDTYLIWKLGRTHEIIYLKHLIYYMVPGKHLGNVSHFYDKNVSVHMHVYLFNILSPWRQGPCQLCALVYTLHLAHRLPPRKHKQMFNEEWMGQDWNEPTLNFRISHLCKMKSFIFLVISFQFYYLHLLSSLRPKMCIEWRKGAHNAVI